MTPPNSDKPSRIAALDILRGYFLLVIIIDHAMRFPTGFDLFTGRGQLWASAAEGFFFISGMVLAIVRGRTLSARPFKEVAIKIWKRSGLLYVWAVLLTVVFTYVGFLASANPRIKPGLIGPTDFSEILFNALTFRYVYGWADFLPHYAIFLFFAPFALWLIHKGYSWLVLLLSIGVWSFGTGFDARWQILFFGGMLAGHYLPRMELIASKIAPATRKKIFIGVVFAFLSTALLSALVVILRSKLMAWGVPYSFHLEGLDTLLAPYFNKDAMRLPRLLLFGLWFTALYMLVRRHESWLLKKLGWLIIPLGRNSLYVYIMHAILLYFLNLAIPYGTTLPANIIINSSFIALIWWLTKKRFLLGIIPR